MFVRASIVTFQKNRQMSLKTPTLTVSKMKTSRTNVKPQPSTSQKPDTQPADESPYSMTEELLQERLRHPLHGNVSRQFFAGFLACLASLSFGTALGWTHSVSWSMMHLQEYKYKSTSERGWLVSIMLLGCSLGVTLSSLLMRQMGPKRVLQVVGPFYILNWWLILTPKISVQLAGRFFLGFLGISYSNAGESLLLQTVDFAVRRYITVFYNSMMILGVFGSRIISGATSTFWLTAVCASVPILHYLLIQIVPESPVFLYATSALKAAKSLAWYRGEGNFYMDMANIKKDWDASRQDSDAYQYMFFNKVVYRGLLVVMSVIFFEVSAGYFIFIFYSIEALTGGIVVFTSFTDICIVTSYFVLTRMFWGTIYALYSWKVRGFLISSCFFTALCLSLFATNLAFNEYDIDIWFDVQQVKWNPMVIVFFYLFFYDMGLHHFPKTLLFEYMPFHMYKKAYLIIQAQYWLISFINIFIFASTFKQIPQFVYFAILSGLTFIGAIFCYFCVIEPKGKSLIQIQLEFGGNPIGTRGALYNQTRQTL